jgi:hypothetical protein
MRVQGVRPGDIVRCERNGVLFLASVTGKAEGVLDVEPITPGVNWFSVKPRQVRDHWRKARG